MSHLNKKSISILFLFVFLSMWACNDNGVKVVDDTTTTTTETGLVRFIHSASSTSELDVTYLDLNDGNYYPFTYETSYGNQYGYYDFYTGNRYILAYLSGTRFAVAEAEFTLEEDEKYTLIAYDYEAAIDPNLYVLMDTTVTPDSGKCYYRFVHLGTDVSMITIRNSGDDMLISELDHLEHSAYFETDPGTHEFYVAIKETGDIIVNLNPMTFLSKQSYTIIFSGTRSNLTQIDFNAVLYRETSL